VVSTEQPGAREPEQPIATRGLTKRYHGVPAVDGVDLAVGQGEIYGFLGPNGAGKTTTMRMLLGLVRPDGGSIRLFGRDPRADVLAALQGVAGIIEEPRLYSYLSGRANLEMLVDFDRGREGRKTIDEVLERVELFDRAGDRVGEYSQGMRQRLGIAACLIRRPRLMLLDEPANGVDPAGMRYLRRLLRGVAEEGTTVFLSSHLLAEVQEVCSRVAIISTGRIVYEGALDELLARAGQRYQLLTDDPARSVAVCRRVTGLSGVEVDGERIAFTAGDDRGLLELMRALTAAEIVVRALTPEQLTLERVFFELTEPEYQQATG
jgi:ABC-2 type transport system ATP-binding protein